MAEPEQQGSRRHPLTLYILLLSSDGTLSLFALRRAVAFSGATVTHASADRPAKASRERAVAAERQKQALRHTKSKAQRNRTTNSPPWTPP